MVTFISQVKSLLYILCQQQYITIYKIGMRCTRMKLSQRVLSQSRSLPYPPK